MGRHFFKTQKSIKLRPDFSQRTEWNVGHDQLDSEKEYKRSQMEKLPKRIHENGIDYILVGDYYLPALRFSEESCY